MKKSLTSLTAGLCLSSLVLASCAHTHTTTVRAVSLNGETDKEVKIYADDLHQNDKYIGSGEAQYSSKRIYGKLFQHLQPSIKLKKPGGLTMKKPLDLMEDKEKKKMYWLFFWLSATIAGLVPLVSFFEDSMSDEARDIAVIGGMALAFASLTGSLYYINHYTYKPIHNFEFVCAKEAAQIIP